MSEKCEHRHDDCNRRHDDSTVDVAAEAVLRF